MRSYAQEILNGILKVPTPQYPGVLVVTGDAQAVLTGKTASEVIIAAYCYGQGRIIATTHDCYLDWISQPDTELKKKLSRSIKTWLAGKNQSTQFIDFKDAVDGDMIENCTLIKWHQDFDPTENSEAQLLSWIENGGGLLCGSTPWGYLSLNPTKTLNDMAMYRFLKNIAGITYLPDNLYFGDEVDVSQNKSKFSNFDMMLDEACSNNNKLSDYADTIITGLANHLKNGTDIDLDKVRTLKENLMSIIRTLPTEETPVENLNEKLAVRIVGKCMFALPGEKSPNVQDFPGDFETEPELLVDVKVKIEAEFPNEWVSTGLYLPAGVMIQVEVNSDDIDGWNIKIGCHSIDNDKFGVYKRWPSVGLVKKLNKQMNFSSPFGGLVLFESTRPGGFEVVLSNVVESPYIDLTKPETVNNWNNRKNAPGLWAELAGENVIFSTPSSCVRHIQYPSEVIQFWDRIIETHHELRGTNPRNQKRERVVNDRQLYDGAYMHSGYPVMTWLDCCDPQHDQCIFDIKKLMIKGNWGLFHEFGHNMQRSEWVFDGSTETTVNIFSMHAYYKLLGQDILDIWWPRNVMNSFTKYFSRKPTYQNYKDDPGMGLMIFAQLIKHFGWQPMYNFMKDYEDDIINGQNLPRTNQEKIDQWVIRYSKIIGKNVRQQFEVYGLPVSKKVDDELKGLPTFLKNDEKNSVVFFDKSKSSSPGLSTPTMFTANILESERVSEATNHVSKNHQSKSNNQVVTDRSVKNQSFSETFVNSQYPTIRIVKAENFNMDTEGATVIDVSSSDNIIIRVTSN